MSLPPFDVEALRAEFPPSSDAAPTAARRCSWMDPGAPRSRNGSSTPSSATTPTATPMPVGRSSTSEASDAIVDEAHAAVADFLGAASPEEIKFGYNMSTLTLHLGRCIGATLGPGDEIVVTTLDHEANVSTWEAMAADRGLIVRKVDVDLDDLTLDPEDLESKLNERTRLVAVGYASNAVGTINPVKEIVARAHEVGALSFVDAVAYAPHGPIDARDLDTDFLACSTYKWFGPHLGRAVRQGRGLRPPAGVQVRPAHDRFETGTANFEGIAGMLAATDYLRDVGRCTATSAGPPARCRQPAAARARGRDGRDLAYERDLVARLIAGLRGAARRDHPRHHRSGPARAKRVPTVSVSLDGIGPRARRRAPRRPGHLRVGRRLLRDRPHRAPGQGRGRWRAAARPRPLQHRRRGRPLTLRGARGAC